MAFKERLQRHVHSETGKTLAKATIYSRLMALKAFTIWLAGRPGCRSRISYADVDYFNVSANDERIAKAVRTRPVPSLDDIRAALAAMSAGTGLERRDRTVVGRGGYLTGELALGPDSRHARSRLLALNRARRRAAII